MYSVRMTTDTPGCVLFLIDQSQSMLDRTPDRITKAMAVADALNRLLSGLVARCADGDAVRDYLHVGVLGYSDTVTPQLAGAGRRQQALVPVSEIALTGRPGVLVAGPGDGRGRLVKVRPWPLRVWVEPQTGPYTSMCAALRAAARVVGAFLFAHPDAFPPIVVNLTDGEATDGDPRDPARRLTSLRSTDGSVLLFNLHVSSKPGPALEYPGEIGPVRDGYARILFEVSSVLPDRMRAAAAAMRYELAPGARGFAYNARLDSLARLLDIGVPGSLLMSRRPR
jgi:hypothetical protein